MQPKGYEGSSKWCSVFGYGQGSTLERKKLWGLETWKALHEIREL